MSKQSRRDGVEHPFEGETAGSGNPYGVRFIITRSPAGQWRELGALGLDFRGKAGVTSSDNFVDESAVGIMSVKVPGAAEQSRIVECALKVPVGALNRAILVCESGIVARRNHAVMLA